MEQRKRFRICKDACMKHSQQCESSTWIDYVDSLCIFLLAVCPLLQHYRGPVVDARATALILCLPYLVWKFWQKNRVNWVLVAPLICFGICKILSHGTSVTEIGREGLLWFYLLAVASGVVDTKKFIRAATAVALLASILIVAQYVLYYLFGYHLQLVPVSMFLDGSSQWIGMAQTGRIGVTGKKLKFYRPSSFFLEPSHMTIYCIPILLLLLLSPRMNRKKLLLAAVITVGILASTSGMGVVLCMGLWFLYFALYFWEDRDVASIRIGKLQIKGFEIRDIRFKGFTWKKLHIKPFTIKGLKVGPANMLFVCGLLIVIVLLYLFVDVFRSSINRIFFNPEGNSALAGRTKSGAYVLMNKMDMLDLLLGKRNPGEEASWYMSAFYGTIYDYGVFACVFSYVFYVYSLFKLKRQYCWMALMILGLSYFTVHTHGSSYMLHFCIFLFAGYHALQIEEPYDLALQIHPVGLLKRRK